MDGMHTWSGIYIKHDSTGNDTSIASPFQQNIVVFNSTKIGLANEEVKSNPYPDVPILNYISTNHTDHTMIYTGYYSINGSASMGLTYVYFYDSLIYNYSDNSIVWYRQEDGYYNPSSPIPSMTQVVHTP